MRRIWLIGTALALALSAHASSASAQEADDEVREVVISYEIGDFDAEREDWSVTAVEVRGTLDPEQAVTVELWGSDARLWMGTVPVTQQVTRFEVDTFVAVGELVEVGVWQQLTLVEDVVILPPDAPPPPDEPEEDDEVEEDPLEPTEVEGEVRERPPGEIVTQSSGGGGSGQLALSMVLAAVVLVILFRTPLPSASTQRWTK